MLHTTLERVGVCNVGDTVAEKYGKGNERHRNKSVVFFFVFLRKKRREKEGNMQNIENITEKTLRL